MGASETKETFVETPQTKSSIEKPFISVSDPRSPDIERTPIIVPNHLADPRSPTEIVDRTPIYLEESQTSPYVRFKLDNPNFVDSPLSVASGKQTVSELEVTEILKEKLKITESQENSTANQKKLLNKRSKSGQNLLRTALFRAQNFETLNESIVSEKENCSVSEELDITNENDSNKDNEDGRRLRFLR